MGIAAQMNALARENASNRGTPPLNPSALHEKNPSLFDTSNLVSRRGESTLHHFNSTPRMEEVVEVRFADGTTGYVNSSALIRPSQRAGAGFQHGAHNPPQFHPSTPVPAPIGGTDIAGLCFSRMMNLVETNRLGAFYTPQAVRELARITAERVNFNNLMRAAQLPTLSHAIEFAVLSLYNIVILVDNSLSMDNPRHKAELRKLMTESTEIAALFDHDGIDVRVLNRNSGSPGGDSLTTCDQIASIVDGLSFSGGTPLGHAIQSLHLSLLVPLVESGTLAKPLMVLVVTDGEPDSETHVVDVIRAGVDFLRRTRYGDKACAYQFAQVGRDPRATEFLSRIDGHKEIGHVVDATGDIELEERQFLSANQNKGISGQYSYYLWLQKILLGAIDPIFDALDERRRKLKL